MRDWVQASAHFSTNDKFVPANVVLAPRFFPPYVLHNLNCTFKNILPTLGRYWKKKGGFCRFEGEVQLHVPRMDFWSLRYIYETPLGFFSSRGMRQLYRGFLCDKSRGVAQRSLCHRLGCHLHSDPYSFLVWDWGLWWYVHCRKMAIFGGRINRRQHFVPPR